MERALLVWNPGAGARDVARRDRVVRHAGAALALEVHELEEGEDATAVARDAVASGVPLVVAAGGDGTVSACASAVIGTSTSLGIVPCGTSNSIARALGLPQDDEGACAAIAAGGVRRIDAARVNGRAMVLLASIGFHADTIESTPPEAKAALGKLAYVIQGIARLPDVPSFEVRIETERGRAHAHAMALTIANLAPAATIWAQGAPELVPDDGLLDVTMACGASTLDAVVAALELAVAAAAGSDATSPRVGWLRCRRAHVIADPPQPILVDGDVIGTTPMDVEIVPRGLAIRVEAPCELGRL